VDRPKLLRLRVLNGQATALLESVRELHWYTEFETGNPTFNETRDLVEQSKVLLKDTEFEGACPNFTPTIGTTGRQYMMAQDIRTIAGSLTAALSSILESSNVLAWDDAMNMIENLKGRLIEAESRSMLIKDDQLRDRCQDLLVRPGKLDTAVRDAAVVLEHRIRTLSGLPQHEVGVELVDKALNRKTGILVVKGLDSERRAVHDLIRGTIGFIKNPLSHQIIADYDVTRARQVVGLIDVLLQLLQETRRREANEVEAAT
jgi:uncharacterized protein (TIGR02391 family)